MELKNSQFMSSEDILKTLTDSNVSKVSKFVSVDAFQCNLVGE